MIDGFASVQALRRAREDRPEPDHTDPTGPDVPGSGQTSPRPPVAPTRPAPATPSGGTPARIGHTAMPTRHELVCYECRYGFAVTGRLDKVFCPKCRTELVTTSITVNDGWTKDVKSVGTIHVSPQAKLKQVELIGTDIIIAGDVTEATIKPTRKLALDTGARVKPSDLDGPELEIVTGARLQLDATLICKNITIRGELTAEIRSKGLVRLAAGSRFNGTIHAAHLIVEDGAALRAELRIGPTAAPAQKAAQEPVQDA